MTKKTLTGTTLALVALAGIVGATILSQKTVYAATDTNLTTSSTNSTTSASADQPDPSQATHVGTNGTKEALLTGDAETKAKAAALAAVPGGTVQRVETDAEGDVYEAHMTKADGSRVTVKFDADFKVTKIENGPTKR